MAIALITGGTSGIGAAFARALAARGDDLVLVARDADRLDEVAADLKQRYGIAVETLSADLADRDDVLRVAERVSSAHQPVDLVVNNAGFGVRARMLDADTSLHEHGIDVMIRAVVMLSVAAGRAMRERGHGAIVNVSSTAGLLTMGSYSAIKAFVTTYTESLSNELRGTGVTATALLPGWVRTEFHERASIRTSAIPGPLWLDADDLVNDCLSDVAAGKVLSLPSLRYKVLMGIISVLPRRGVRAVSKRLTSTRH